MRLPPGLVKAWVGFCAPVDLCTRPRDKFRPVGFPIWDPVAFLEPLFDAYAGTERERNEDDERCHPTLAKREQLPPRLLFLCAGIDILIHGQQVMVEKLRRERKIGEEGEVEMMVVKSGFHGFVERK